MEDLPHLRGLRLGFTFRLSPPCILQEAPDPCQHAKPRVSFAPAFRSAIAACLNLSVIINCRRMYSIHLGDYSRTQLRTLVCGRQICVPSNVPSCLLYFTIGTFFSSMDRVSQSLVRSSCHLLSPTSNFRNTIVVPGAKRSVGTQQRGAAPNP